VYVPQDLRDEQSKKFVFFFETKQSLNKKNLIRRKKKRREPESGAHALRRHMQAVSTVASCTVVAQCVWKAGSTEAGAINKARAEQSRATLQSALRDRPD